LKKIILSIFFALLFVASVSCEILPGFWGIPFGSSLVQIQDIMTVKGYKPATSASYLIEYDNVKFAGRECTVVFLLENDRFYLGDVEIVPNMNKAFNEYTSLKNDLTGKYGIPTLDREEYKFPYKKNDGYTETAIFLNYATIDATWRFEDGNRIKLLVWKNEKTGRIEVSLGYVEGNIWSQVINKEKQSISEDL
jgi:hypothetical protein